MNTSIKVLLYTSKKLSNGEHPIMLRVIKDRKAKYISIGVSCSLALWDINKNLPTKKHPSYTQIKVLIAAKRLEAERLVYDIESDKRNFSAYEIKSKLKKERVNNPFVIVYFDSIIERFIGSGQIKNAEIYKDTKRNLSYFINGKKIHFSDIDIQFINKFVEFMKMKGKGMNTIYIYLRTLRALINKAIKEEVCSEKYYPFKNYSLSKYSKIKTDKRAISKDEISKIIFVNLDKHPHLIDAKNIFLFSFYCRGMNFIDIALLRWKDLKNERLIYTRQKTKELFNIELLEPAKKILKYYHNVTFTNLQDFVFPIFNSNHSSPISMYNRKVKMLRKINKDLKEIGKLANLESELTTYVARHTYATILRQKGISTAVISEALGHDSEKTTQIYLVSFENSVLDNASKAIL
jgi:integrase/recombinase XerD